MSRGGLAMEKSCQAPLLAAHLGHDDDGDVVQHGPCHDGDGVGVLAQQVHFALREQRHGHRPVDDERVGDADQHHDLGRGRALRALAPSHLMVPSAGPWMWL